MKESPLLNAQKMADFAMSPSFLRPYQNKLLAHLEKIHDADYVADVKRLMNQIASKRRGKTKRASALFCPLLSEDCNLPYCSAPGV